MCLAVFALNCHPDFPVIVAANRDEYHARASLPAAPWNDNPEIIAGLDLVGGGTWMGVTRGARYALVTNYRAPSRFKSDAPTRGALVSQFLQDDAPVEESIRKLAERGDQFNGFNLIGGDREQSWYYSNRGAAPRRLMPGVHGVSNHLVDTPWPKLLRVKQVCSEMLSGHPEKPDFGMLTDAFMEREPAADDLLPDTGIARSRERLLSSPFIVSPDYGTRCTTLLLLGADAGGELKEMTFDAAGRQSGVRHWRFSQGAVDSVYSDG